MSASRKQYRGLQLALTGSIKRGERIFKGLDTNDLILLYAYNRWANAKVSAACTWVTPQQIIAPAQASFGSLLGTLAHILGAEMLWRMRLQEGTSPPRLLNAEDFSTLEALTILWQEEEHKMQRFVDSLGNQDLDRWVEFTTTSGKAQSSTLWKALLHVVNHGTQFRAEAGVVLDGFGHSPGDLDLLWYLRESGQR
jgi:uncharacterized damage-inducible protein DinB